MADVTITGLPDAALPLDGTERVPMDKAGVTVDAAAADVAATLPDATVGSAGKMTAADKAKLDAVATGATANAADADLRDRATHTGTQAAGTITGLATVATTGAYGDLSGLPTLGTAAALDSGTGVGNVVILDGSSRLPAVDGSQLTNLPPGGASDLDGLTDVTITAPATDQVLKYDGSGWVNAAAPGGGGGTVTSVAATVPTGFTVTGSPITTTGTLAFAFDTGYSLPTDAEQANWDTAFSERAQWDGGATGLNAATGRASLGLATVATTGAYADLSGLPTLGTAAALDVGTGASNVVQLDGSSRLPAVDGSQLTNLPGGGSAHVIQEEGTPLTQRANLNFVGASVTATDDAGNDATVITITAGAGGGDALTADPLSQFAATTSAQLAGVIR